MDLFGIVLFATLTFAAYASSEQVILMQTPDCRSCVWSWSAYHFNCNMCQFSGWGHPTVPGEQTMNRYSVCDALFPASGHTASLLKEPSSWLRSDLIYVGEVRRVDVTVKHTIIECPQPASVFCKELFGVFVWESNTRVARDKIPNPLNSNSLYRHFANITRQPNNPATSVIPLVATSKYIVLGFRDQGGCRTLHSVKVTYNACPQETLNHSLVTVPRTSAPINKAVPVKGRCTADSVYVPGSLILLCESSGEWNTSLLEGRCVCKEDMENTGGKCEDCKSGEHNNQRGLNCTALPSAPKNISITYVNQSAVRLSWQPPEVTGDHSHVVYDVICLKPCRSDDDRKCVEETCRSDVGFIPQQKGLNETQVIVINLFSFVNYTFKIYTRNRVSDVAKRKHQVEGNFTAITVRTLGAIPGKPEVFIEQKEVTVHVSWTLKHKNGFIKNYHVTYVRKDDSSDSKSVATKKTKQNFKDLKAGKTYEFQVFAKNSFGKGPVGVKTFKVRNGGVAETMVVSIAAGGGSMLFILLLVIVIAILVFRRRKSKRNVQRNYMRSVEHGGELGQRHYINPANYLNLMELLSTFASEIERSKTKLEGLIGQGEFADVYKGTLKTQGGRDVVAIKVLRPRSNVKNQKDFLSEASIMGQFNHPNVVRLIGVVTQSRPMMILTEFLESGSLDHFLKDRDGQLTSLQLVGMARGVACGMVYLSEKNLIHRDLAARNILVGENMLCKVSDFGLSRELADDDPDSEYETQGGKIAVRWTAPEALQCRKFSSASDVWSYGILVWEIMSFGDRPYWEWTNIDVINRVEFGYRLPPPKGCPNVIHSLMMECWESDKNERPKFAEIVSRLDKIIRSPDVLMDISLAPEPREVEASNQSDVPEFESVDDWLIFLKMDSHLKLFQAANVDSLDKVAKLEDKDLREIGVKLIGHRNKMNKSIKSIKGRYVNRGMDEDEGAI